MGQKPPLQQELSACPAASERQRVLIGRVRERELWHEFLGPHGTHPVWFLAGAGGIGKTTLLRAFERDARLQGLKPLFLNAGEIIPNPAAVQDALQAAAAGKSFADYCTGMPAPVLLIDTFEAWSGFEWWLWQQFLPAQPGHLKVVIAGRKPPSREWQLDPGWQDLLMVTHLEAFTESESRAYLQQKGIESKEGERLVNIARGHPLVLATGADAVARGQAVPASLLEADRATVELLVDTFTREARDAGQLHALDALAVVRELNETLLARMLEDESRAVELFAWLRGLAFVEQRENGLRMHEVVRESLWANLSAHAPERYEKLARNAVHWIIDRLETAPELTWGRAAALAADAMFALRAAPLVAQYLAAPGSRALYLDHWRSEDTGQVHAMIRRHEGEESLHWFRFWHGRSGATTVLVRDGGQRVRAVLLKLNLESLDPQARRQDPMTRQLWEALPTRFHFQPGDHVPFIRHWVTHDYAVTGSPEKTLLLMAIHTYNMTAHNLRLSAQVFDEQDGQWEEQAAALGIHLLADSDTRIGGRNWRIYYNDWAIEPPSHYYRRFADLVFGADPGLPPSYQPALDQAAFEAAVYAALKDRRHPKRLARNPLADSALVETELNRQDPVSARRRAEALERVLESAIQHLQNQSEPHRQGGNLLHQVYLTPGTTQKDAADALHMSYSTLRRHLAAARKALAAHLLLRERSLR